MSRFDPPIGGVNAGAEFESVRIIKRPPPEPVVSAPSESPAPALPSPPTDDEVAAFAQAKIDGVALAEPTAWPLDDDIFGAPDDLGALGGASDAPIADPSTGEASASGAPAEGQLAGEADGEPAVAAEPSLPTIDPTGNAAPPEPVASPVKPRSVIVIDADAPADPVGTGTTDATGDRVDPRIRDRRRQVQRAAGRKRFRVLIGVAAAIVLLVGGSILIQSPLFSVRDVRIDGVHYADATAIKAVADGLYGQPLFRADLAKAQDTILLQPWVRRVRIIRTWPRSITIDIAERTPIGAVPTEDQAWRVIDIEGRVLAITEGQPKDFMAIRGDPKAVEVGGIMSPQMISGARLADSLPGRLKSITREVIVGGDGAVALEISPKGRILLGTIDDLRAKLISVLTFLDSCPGVQFETLDARAATALVMTPPNCHKPPLTKKAP